MESKIEELRQAATAEAPDTGLDAAAEAQFEAEEKQAVKAEEELRNIAKTAAAAEKKAAQCFRDALAVIMQNHNIYSNFVYLERATNAYLGVDVDGWKGSPQTVKNTKSIFDKAWRFAGIFGEDAVEVFLATLEQLPGRGQENARTLLKATIDMLGKTPEKLTAEWLEEAHAGRIPTIPVSETQWVRDAAKGEADKIAPAEPAQSAPAASATKAAQNPAGRPEGVVRFARRPLKEVWKASVMNFDEMVKRVQAVGVLNDEADDAIRAFNSAFAVLEGIIEAANEAEARQATEEVEKELAEYARSHHRKATEAADTELAEAA